MSSQARMPQFVSGLLAEIIKKRFAFLTFMSGGLKVKGLFLREKIKQSDFCMVSLTVYCYSNHYKGTLRLICLILLLPL